MATAAGTSDGTRLLFAFAAGLLAGGAAIGWWRSESERARLHEQQARGALAQVEARLAVLERARAPDGPPAIERADPRGARDAAAPATLAGKPVDEVQAAARLRTGVDDAERARRVEDAQRIEAALRREPVVLPGDARSAAPAARPSAAELEAQEQALREAAERAEVVTAFNQLLESAGLEGWRLLEGRPLPDERALGDAVLAQRGVRGVAIGSLVAQRLRLERDPVTGLAALAAEGAHGIEGGVEVAYEGARYRIEIPGVLPVELVPERLRALFAFGDPGAVPTPADGAAAVVLVNRALGLEKGQVLRFRRAEELAGDRFKKAVIDLAFDGNGLPTQTVLADAAWFELDPEACYAELCCEGGEMVEGGLKRPLFRGKLRLPLRDLTPAHWQGVPAVRRTAGS